MHTFFMNGILWRVVDVPPNSDDLIDRKNIRTLATTDGYTKTIYVSTAISGTLRKRVIAHEMGHAVCFSYNLIPIIHSCCIPNKRLEMEEFICNFVADYGEMIFEITYQILGDSALQVIPIYFERIMA